MPAPASRPHGRPAALAAPTPWGRWAVAWACVGGLLALLAHAPARWLAMAVDHASGGWVQLHQAQGNVWQGSGVLVLRHPQDPQAARRLPSPLSWAWGGLWAPGVWRLHSACCTERPLELRAERADGQWVLRVGDATSQWPVHLLSGWGAPWHTVNAQGTVALHTRGLQARWQQGRWQWQGQLQAQVQHLSSQLSALRPVGSYEWTVQASPTAAPTVRLQTLQGALQLQCQGEWLAGGWRFRGEARAQAGFEAVLDNLLNILGRREGDRSLLSWG